MKKIILSIVAVVIGSMGIGMWFRVTPSSSDPEKIKIHPVAEGDYTKWEKVVARLADPSFKGHFTVNAHNLLEFSNQLTSHQKDLANICAQQNLSTQEFIGISRSIGQTHAYALTRMKVEAELEEKKKTLETIQDKRKKKKGISSTLAAKKKLENKPKNNEPETEPAPEQAQCPRVALEEVRAKKQMILAKAEQVRHRKARASMLRSDESLNQMEEDLARQIVHLEDRLEKDFSENKQDPTLRRNLPIFYKYQSDIENLWITVNEKFQRRTQ